VAGPDGGLLPAKQSRIGEDVEGGEAWREELFAIGRLMALAVTAKVSAIFSFALLLAISSRVLFFRCKHCLFGSPIAFNVFFMQAPLDVCFSRCIYKVLIGEAITQADVVAACHSTLRTTTAHPPHAINRGVDNFHHANMHRSY
jgi:hypothetical protein